MSFEWNSRNGRGRLRIYSDDILSRFDNLTGELNSRTRNTMIVHDDNWSGERTIIVAEEAAVWEDERYVYVQLRGRSVRTRESVSRISYGARRRTSGGIPISTFNV